MLTLSQVNTPPQKERKVSERLITSVLIAPFTQIKFGLYMIVISLLFMAATGYLLVRSFMDQYHQVMDIFNVIDPTIKWEMMTNEVFHTNIIRMGVCFGLYLIVMFYTVFKLTHRYYGPLVSIERFVSEVTEGHYNSRVTIRSKDELQDLVKKLNKLAVELERRHGLANVKDKEKSVS